MAVMDTSFPPQGSRLLLVDSNPNVRGALLGLLRQEYPGCHVDTAASPAQASLLAVETAPVLGLVNIDAPDGQGLATLRSLRGLMLDMRLVALSLHPVEHFRERAIEAGATDCVCISLADDGLSRLLGTFKPAWS